nr:hypothetical protein [Tropicibacter sp. R15_0]
MRFVRPQRVEDTGHREGFFCAAYELREKQDLDEFSSAQLEEYLAWFRENLPIPARFSRSRSQSASQQSTRGLSWFKPQAAEALGKAHGLMALLQSHGYVFETLRSDRIGYVVYEDDWQVVAEPFADTET